MIYVSPSCERISGYTAQDFIDNPSFFREIILSEDKEIWDEHYAYLQEEIKLEHDFESIIGNSPVLKVVLFKVQQVADTDTSVLVLGETGTGKELISRAVHNSSSRRQYPLVKVNCAALPPSLIESELFGHERGAFTGAQNRQIGRFEVADSTSIFLDETGDLPLELQTKLLQVLQDGEFERLGSSRTIKVNVRVIAATNRDLEAQVRKGEFRQDLFFRLNPWKPSNAIISFGFWITRIGK
jgi:chemotaxis protein methyltransferase CheR